jgi:hypothetical protein
MPPEKEPLLNYYQLPNMQNTGRGFPAKKGTIYLNISPFRKEKETIYLNRSPFLMEKETIYLSKDPFFKEKRSST